MGETVQAEREEDPNMLRVYTDESKLQFGSAIGYGHVPIGLFYVHGTQRWNLKNELYLRFLIPYIQPQNSLAFYLCWKVSFQQDCLGGVSTNMALQIMMIFIVQIVSEVLCLLGIGDLFNCFLRR